MSNKKRRSVENEFRSSELYQKISKSGGDIADALADSLGKASRVADDVMDTVGNVVKSVDDSLNNRNRYSGQHPYKNPPPPKSQDIPYTPSPNGVENNQPPVQGSRESTYHYSRPSSPPPPPNSNSYRQTPPVQRNGSRPAHNSVPASPPKVVHPNNVKVKMVRQPSNTKFYLTGILAVITALIMPMYEYWHLAAFTAIVAGTFFLTKSIFKGKKRFVAVPIESKVPAAETESEPAKTGNADVDKAIQEGYDYLRRLRLANDAIEDEQMSDCISRIEQSSAGIFSYISEHPEKVGQIRKFMNYYLPTTMKLLDSYQRLNAQAVKGENIQTTLTDIDRILYTVAGAFEKQLDSLFSEEAMDISTDISVFETMLKQEGFVSDEAMPESKTSTK